MKTIFLALAFICGSLQVNANEHIQQKAIEKFLFVKTLDSSQIIDICAPSVCLSESAPEDGLSYQASDDANSTLLPKRLQSETYLVTINVADGYTFHLADYYGQWGHSRVVTCLDGPLRGLQGIADNGVLMIQSSDVKWHRNYFEHKYPAAKIYSYPYKQVFELK